MGRDRDPDRPIDPDEARAHGSDPDAVRTSGDGPDGGTRSDESAPRRVGDVRQEREGTDTDRTDPEGHHLTDPDAGVNRATTDAGRDTARGPAGDPQEGWNIPTRGLPPIGTQSLPEPLPVSKLVGASVVILATAMGSGELIFWPFITTRVGVGLLWLAAIGFALQYILNMEIERYTLSTGETAITGFTRIWKPWGIIFILGAILPNAFPGWAAGGATTITYLFNLGEGAIPWIAAIALVATALALTLSPVVYQALEKIQMVLVTIIALFLILAIFIATELSMWTGIVTRAPTGAANFPRYMGELGAAFVLGAIAFAGAGGANNLCQSNYIRDKGLGMGARMPKIVSPITGEEVAAPSLGYTFPVNEENLRRWRQWWKVCNQEQLVTFLGLGLVMLIALSVLVASTVGIVPVGEAADVTFIQDEARILGNRIGGWFEAFFLFASTVVLFSTSIGIMDYVSRLTSSELKIGYFPRSQTVTESRIYFAMVWIIAIAGSLILLAGLQAPLILLVIAAAGGGVVMFLYSGMLIWLNTRSLPDPIKLKGWRLVVMWITFIIFAFFSMFLVYDQIRTNVFGG